MNALPRTDLVSMLAHNPATRQMSPQEYMGNLMLLIVGFYLALGTFMEGMSMVICTIPLLFPVVKALGYDPVWFGVVITMLVEIAMISPPDGTVLYVLQGMRRQPGPITDVFSGVMPFMLVYMLAIIILMIFPSIALWLPAVLS